MGFVTYSGRFERAFVRGPAVVHPRIELRVMNQKRALDLRRLFGLGLSAVLGDGSFDQIGQPPGKGVGHGSAEAKADDSQ